MKLLTGTADTMMVNHDRIKIIISKNKMIPTGSIQVFGECPLRAHESIQQDTKRSGIDLWSAHKVKQPITWQKKNASSGANEARTWKPRKIH